MQMVTEEVGMLLGIPGQIEKLSETVRHIQCVLADAERKESKGSAIERWLMQLKDVMYDADDVIDLCQIKAKERLAGSSSYSSSNASCGFPLLSCFRNPLFSREIGSKIKEINSRLEGIAKRRADLGLTESPIIPRVDSIIHRKTDHLIVVDDIVGEKIEEDTEMLVSWLTEEEKGVRENICVVAILGMGGIGKTTLAKKIFNDPRIEDEFQLKIWVLPNGIESEIEDHREIAMQIVEKCDGLPLAIKSVGGVLCTKDNSRENWQAILRSNVWSMDGLPGDVHQTFYLSYEDLSSPLKQCFIFCSIFPEDFQFRKDDLIYRWLAEGFLQYKDNFWELGNVYYAELLQRNLLEDTYALVNQGECKMHDIFVVFCLSIRKK
ncbi:putative disease resistance RPP13-like protein 1 [Carex littledalei]|uniref:Putative disease resistance RPP13-like protein 1 n=1 Tax=Carex littledalei TaxID=544730 RepID=A0A833QEH0_9POAL|nr:putative disease resistance RPP13-like protein 1 [Carex littledalei]